MMKIKLKAILAMVTMMFCFSSFAFATDYIATISCPDENVAEKVATEYYERGYGVKIIKKIQGNYEVRAFYSDIPTPFFGPVEEKQYVDTRFFDTLQELDAFVIEKKHEGFFTKITCQRRGTEIIGYHVKVYR